MPWCHVNARVGQSRCKEIFKTHIYRDWAKFKTRQSLSEEESAHTFKGQDRRMRCLPTYSITSVLLSCPAEKPPAGWPAQRPRTFFQGPHPAKGSERSHWAAHTPHDPVWSLRAGQPQRPRVTRPHHSQHRDVPQTHILGERQRVPQAMALREPTSQMPPPTPPTPVPQGEGTGQGQPIFLDPENSDRYPQIVVYRY